MESRIAQAAEEISSKEHSILELKGELKNLEAAKEFEVSKLLQLGAEQEQLTNEEEAKRDGVIQAAMQMESRLETAKDALERLDEDAAAHRKLQETVQQLEFEKNRVLQEVKALNNAAEEGNRLELQKREAVLEDLKLLEQELIDTRLELDSGRAEVSSQLTDLESLKRWVLLLLEYILLVEMMTIQLHLNYELLSVSSNWYSRHELPVTLMNCLSEIKHFALLALVVRQPMS